ncbi:hypothetical protein DAPPUDRAFT_308612 [Daphnia pulex]|uniref:Uncharacterized protein n=1 Tax=Daphnia pulex TaxID=6669 RepID=E9H8D2_DAPPU|nr:hypothetical protein DAPPUDRAFT_308612 [Daphnia pulex]|eukprot:EFX71960.1 hypothetical protein DAPPUDRAFT_308612 [Daphnia pulex]
MHLNPLLVSSHFLPCEQIKSTNIHVVLSFTISLLLALFFNIYITLFQSSKHEFF